MGSLSFEVKSPRKIYYFSFYLLEGIVRKESKVRDVFARQLKDFSINNTHNFFLLAAV